MDNLVINNVNKLGKKNLQFIRSHLVLLCQTPFDYSKFVVRLQKIPITSTSLQKVTTPSGNPLRYNNNSLAFKILVLN